VRSTEVLSGRTEKYQKPDGSSGYDALNRLTNVDYGDGQTQSYTFDAMGNRLSRVDSASGTTTSSYNAANMLLSTGGYGASGFQNDADGNTLVGNGRTNTWDSQNRLASCVVGNSTTSYTYGADGLRRHMFTYQQFQAHPLTHGATSQDVTLDPGPALDIGTSYAYDGTMLVREGHTQTANGTSSLPSANVTATYFIGARGPEYRRDDTQPQTDAQGHRVTKARWYVYDGLGSVVGEVDPLGNLTSSPKYDVYGAGRANGGSATSRQGFVGGLGHVSDTETGLIYMQATYYDPSVGRFASEDPSRNGGNWFAYCGSSPTNGVDPDGKIVAWVCAAVVGAFAGMGTYLVDCALDHKNPTAKGFLLAAAIGAVVALIAFASYSLAGLAVGSTAIASFANGSLDCLELALATAVGFDAGMLGSLGAHATTAVFSHMAEIGFALAAADNPDLPDPTSMMWLILCSI